jgi:NTP pyrophosphatase (non-canonical NTP hydrolase)
MAVGENDKLYMSEYDYMDLRNAVNTVVFFTHALAHTGGWWDGVDKDDPLLQAVKVGLIAGEAHEAIEAIRKDSADDHLPEYSGRDTELADVLIRTGDFAGAYAVDLGQIVVDKLRYNAQRQDHKPENRKKSGGKRF